MIPDRVSDAAARRELAEKVREAAERGASYASADGVDVGLQVKAAGIAASAVVLASDLRARAETRQEFIDRLTEDIRAGRANVSPWHVIGRETEEPIPAGAPMEVNPATGKVRVARPSLLVGRERLANVERLLAASLSYRVADSDGPSDPALADAYVDDALSEVRSLLGDG